jgi:putative component of toxin-antitoxin plasmid stabilization module
MNSFLLRIRLGVLIACVAIGGGITASAQISLTATGGTTTGSYSTISAAFSAINAGTHQGVIAISVNANTSEPAAPTALVASGQGGANYSAITIRPTATVTVSGSPNSSRAVIELDGADNVTINGDIAGGTVGRDMTIVNNSASSVTANAAMWLIGRTTGGLGVTNTTISNCVVIGNGNIAATSNTTQFGIYVAGASFSTSGTGDLHNNITIDNNEVRRAHYGIFTAGTTTNLATNITISNNIIGSNSQSEFVMFRGILVNNSTSPLVQGNTVFNIKNVMTSTAGIEIGTSASNTGAMVRRNRVSGIYNLNTGGWTCSGIILSGGTNHNLDNNLVYDILATNYSSYSTFSAAGIRITSGTGHKLYYNSVNMFGVQDVNSGTPTTPISAALWVTSTAVTGLDIRNNIFANTMTSIWPTFKGFAVMFASGYNFTTSNITINNNLYYSPVSGTHFVGGTSAGATQDRATLTDLRALTLQDANSISGNPLFTSEMDLTPLPNSPALGAGTPIAGFTTDFLGKTRSATSPMIGAYELAGPFITYTRLENTNSTDNRLLLDVSITDISGINVTSGTSPRLYYKRSTDANTFNDNTSATTGWKFVEANNSSSPFNFTIDYSKLFGGSASTGISIQYFVIAQNLAVTPNVTLNSGVLASTPTSVALTSAHFPVSGTLNSFNIFLPLSGVINVGTGETYTTLTGNGGLFQTINNNIVAENIIINITSNLTETGTHALNQWLEQGPGKNYSITIRPSGSSRTITGAATANGLIYLNGTDRVTIDGRVEGIGSANGLTITNTATTGTYGVIAVNGASLSNGAFKNTIRNVNIIGGINTVTGISGISVFGNDVDSLTIQQNSFAKVNNAILVRGVSVATSHDAMHISDNIIGPSTATTVDLVISRGIDVQFINNSSITGNRIQNMVATVGSSIAAIDLGANVNNTFVNRNIINNIKQNSTSGFGTYGININATSTSNITIANNFISGISGYGLSTGTVNNPFGIRITGGTGHRVYYNTVDLTGAFLNTSGLSSAFLLTGGTGLIVRNNIFINRNTASSTTPKAYAIYSTSTPSVFGSLSSNNYAVQGSNGVLGNVSLTESFTLGALQTATGDFNAKNVLVTFANSSAGNLRLISINPELYGVVITEVTTDIDNEPRRSYYMGADEVIPTIVINRQAIPYRDCFGRTAVVSVDASINFGAAMAYRWQKDGVPLFDNERFNGTSTPTLTITNTRPMDAGEYSLRIIGNSGTEPVISQIVNVTITAPVEVTSQPQSAVICPGGEASLSISTEGTVDGVQWQKEDPNSPNGYSNIAGATTKQIFLNNATNNTSGKYRALIFGTCGGNSRGVDTTITDVATIFVGLPTWIAKQVENEITKIGGSISLSVEAEVSGTRVLGSLYQWYRNGVALSDDARINGTTSSVMTINEVQPSDTSAIYYAEVTGTCGTAKSNTAKIFISGVSIALAPQTVSVCPGTVAVFNVSAVSTISGANMTYQWMKDGIIIVNGGRINGANTATLTISGATQADVSANYTVKVTSQPGSATVTSAPVALSLKATTSITLQPQSRQVCEGEVLGLDVAAEGAGLNYEWRFNGMPITTAGGSLYSPIATPGMSGEYTVLVKGDCGEVLSQTVNVTVKAKPSITVQPVAVSQNQFSTLNLSVEAAGAGLLTYQWYLNGNAIAGATNATYSKTNTGQADAGIYHVVVIGECGTVNSTEVVVQITTGVGDITAAGYSLQAIIPSPVSETGTITFTLAKDEIAKVVITDMFGREVAVLADGYMSQGEKTIIFSSNELKLNTGSYLYTVSTPTFRATRQMIVVK